MRQGADQASLSAPLGQTPRADAPANPHCRLKVTLCRRVVDSQETAIPIRGMQEFGSSLRLRRTLVNLATGVAPSGIAGPYTLLGMPGEPRWNQGVESWSASLPHWSCWLPELPIPLHNLAPDPGRPRRRPSLPRPGPVSSRSRVAVRISKAGLEAFTAVIVDVAGDLYIADGGNQRVRRVGPGESITTFAAPGRRPSAGTALRPQLLNPSCCGGWRPSKGQPLPGDDALWRADPCLQTIVPGWQTLRGP